MHRPPPLLRALAPVLSVLTLILLTALPAMPAAAATGTLATPAGLWSPLDNSGKPIGLIAIFEQGGQYYGRIEPLDPSDDRTERCTHCTGSRRNLLMDGLLLMRHLRYQDGAYVGGDILDPRTGRIYGCELHLIDGGRKLVMRGYLGLPMLGRSQVWQRMQGEPGVKVWPVPSA